MVIQVLDKKFEPYIKAEKYRSRLPRWRNRLTVTMPAKALVHRHIKWFIYVCFRFVQRTHHRS